MNNLLFEEESYLIRGAAFEVYKEKGHGFLEAVYQECMEKECALQNIPFTSQHKIELTYKGQPLFQTYKPDLICYDKIIVEIKAVTELLSQHEAQLLNYLHATEYTLGFLINFGSHPKAQIKRIIL